MEAGLQGLDVGAFWIWRGCDSLFCRSSRADCCARLGEARRPHDGRKCIGNGRHFDGVVSAARCQLRFTLDSGICRALDPASSLYASLIQIRTPLKLNQTIQRTAGRAAFSIFDDFHIQTPTASVLASGR